MADTLQSLAGAAFRSKDVIRDLHLPVKLEELVLDRYVFLPFSRSGIAAALATPFDWSLPARTRINLVVPVIDERGGINAEMQVNVYGPGDVTEIDGRQIIRAAPKADVVNAEVDDLVHVEFDRPDLPWLFTPAGPDAQGRLVPWITLVVAERRHVAWGERRGAVQCARIRRDQLQPLGDAWAWAHAQVMGARGDLPTSEPTLERRLSEVNAAQNLSRLICPRRLDDHTEYVACVVPTFLAGVQAGLGLTPVTTLAPAWGTKENFAAGDPFDMVALPVYYSWSFGTTENGNFESLAQKLRTAVAPPGVGRRRVDATRPWAGLELGAADQGAEIVVTGPVVSPQPTESTPEDDWPSEAEQHWLPIVTAGLATKLNEPDQQAHTPNPGPPRVGPPLYGATHVRETHVEPEDPPGDALQPPWFRELNLDPRHRIVAGLGTRVVQAEQEDLMVAAWNQIDGVEKTNRTLRLAQLAKRVGTSLHRRHLARLRDAALVTVTERVHAKILHSDANSVWASIRRSSLPTSVTVGAFRRLARVRGPIVKVATRAKISPLASVDALTAQTDRLTTSWVIRYEAADGVRDLGQAAGRQVTGAVAAQVAPGVDVETLLTRWREQLAKPGPSDELTDERLASAHVADFPGLGATLLNTLIARVAGTTPTQREMEADPERAFTGASHARLFDVLLTAAGRLGLHEVHITRVDAERLELESTQTRDAPFRAAVSTEAMRALVERGIAAARRHRIEVPTEDFERSAERLRGVLARGLQPEGPVVLGALQALGSKVVLDDPFADDPRDRISVPGLGIVTALDPAKTVPARVAARLAGGSGRFPGWLPADWFDDMRIEPVMAHPRFTYPMYEPLYRYDREWLIPGLGLIGQSDVTTLLVTNNRFIEAYLVGLNHEMARELLWREFPTDQRGTYFSSFWTYTPELSADLHEPLWRSGKLGTHVNPNLDGRIVFLARGDLIRRYPGVIAHAALEGDIDENGVPLFQASSPVETLFHIHLPPNILLAGFSLTKAQIDNPEQNWWFTLSENPTEPRFGLDPSRVNDVSRDDLTWSDLEMDVPGGFLSAAHPTNLVLDKSRWGASSAEVAYLLFQLPARAAFRAKAMVTGAKL
ncbi:MAG: hypothetical protein QM778_18475 [Myxococcales bacterium]